MASDEFDLLKWKDNLIMNGNAMEIDRRSEERSVKIVGRRM